VIAHWWNQLWKLHARVLRRVGHYRWFGVLAVHVVTPIDRAVIKASRGRLSMTGPEFLTMLLTTTGRKSGKQRTIPVAYVRDGEKLVAVSSNVGLKTAASWPKNLLADPRARIEISGIAADYRSRIATDEEVARYMPRLTEMWPTMDTYFERTGVRNMFVFEPVDVESGG
jgi:deazaflavin-dependent oxidoreductase (nitroreductase family)